MRDKKSVAKIKKILIENRIDKFDAEEIAEEIFDSIYPKDGRNGLVEGSEEIYKTWQKMNENLYGSFNYPYPFD